MTTLSIQTGVYSDGTPDDGDSVDERRAEIKSEFLRRLKVRSSRNSTSVAPQRRRGTSLLRSTLEAGYFGRHAKQENAQAPAPPRLKGQPIHTPHTQPRTRSFDTEPQIATINPEDAPRNPEDSLRNAETPDKTPLLQLGAMDVIGQEPEDLRRKLGDGETADSGADSTPNKTATPILISTASPDSPMATTVTISSLHAPEIVRLIVEHATLGRNSLGNAVFTIKLADGILGGLQLSVCAVGRRRVQIKVDVNRHADCTFEAELSSLVSSLNENAIATTELTIEYH